MAELKTKLNDASVVDFLNTIEDSRKRTDSFTICKIMEEITGAPPKMWGANIVGFGNYRLKYAGGREGDWFLTGFSPRKQNLTLYLMSGFEHSEKSMAKLGKYKTGKSCLYIKHLEDIDMDVLKGLVHASVDHLKNLNA